MRDVSGLNRRRDALLLVHPDPRSEAGHPSVGQPRPPEWCKMQGPAGPAPPMTAAIVFFCHGARAASWRAPFDRIVDDFRAQQPGQRVELAFLELMTPSLPEVIDRLARQGIRAIRVVPLFLAPGSHTREDLPALLADARSRWPDIVFESTSTLTESAPIRAAIVAWALNTGANETRAEHPSA